MSIAPVVLNKELPTGSDGSQLRLNKKQGVEQEEERGWRGSDLCYRSIWSPLSFTLSLKMLSHWSNIQTQSRSGKISFWLTALSIPFPALVGLAGRWEGQIGDMSF